MGQQQLLLVILVTIIVGIATVVAINIFGTAADQANRDAVRQDLMGAAAQAQGIWARPAMMGGVARDFGNTDMLSADELLIRLNIPGDRSTDGEISNENGIYSLNGNAGSRLEIQAVPTSGAPNIFAVVCRDTDGQWNVRIEEESAQDPTEGCAGGEGGNGGNGD